MDDVLAPFEATSALAVLYAACSSPSATHRLPTLAALLSRTATGAAGGSRTAQASDLEDWALQLAHAMPGLAAVEDWLPLDPRVRVHASVEQRAWPLHPGLLEEPHRLLPTVRRYAQLLDPTLGPRLGFGLADVTDVALRLLEPQTSLARAWSLPRPAHPGQPPMVSADEVRHAAQHLQRWHAAALTMRRLRRAPHTLASLLERSSVTPNRAAAWAAVAAWTARDARRLPAPAEAASDRLIGALFLTGPFGLLPVPPGLVLEGLAAATDRWMLQVTSGGRHRRRHLHDLANLEHEHNRRVMDRLGGVLRRAPGLVVGPAVARGLAAPFRDLG